MNELAEENHQQEDQFNRGIGISFALHAVLISFFTLKAVFFTPEQIDFTQAIRVDMVGLPDKVDPQSLPAPSEAKENPKPVKEEPKPVVEKPAEKAPPKKVEAPKPELPKHQPKKDDSINLEKNKVSQQSAIEKLKAMAALEKIKAEVAEDKKKTPPAATGAEKDAGKVKGNMVSPGTSLTGLNKLQHDNYGAELNSHIKKNWELPEWLSKKDLKAQVAVFIDSRGNILERKLVKSSGNPEYDGKVLEAIDKSAPFPAPPEKFQAYLSVNGILIGFPE